MAAAAALGYRPNPLVSAWMSHRRLGRPAREGAVIGVITEHLRLDTRNEIHRPMYAGMREACAALGYGMDEFWLPEYPGAARLSAVLRARGIEGVIVTNFRSNAMALELEWANVAAVTTTGTLASPQLHRVMPDFWFAMRLALERLKALGYRRIGFACSEWEHHRVEHMRLGAFLAEQARVPARERVPPFLWPGTDYAPEPLHRWMARHCPEVVILDGQWDQARIIQWVRRGPCRPAPAVASLKCRWPSDELTGIWGAPREVGYAAVEHLAAMIVRNERGVPPQPHALLVRPVWNPGVTAPGPRRD